MQCSLVNTHISRSRIAFICRGKESQERETVGALMVTALGALTVTALRSLEALTDYKSIPSIVPESINLKQLRCENL